MQTINRNNYEELFLLYIDNELDAERKLAVENFVQQNPDLAVEFNMLMQTKSNAGEIIFFDKENLLRTEGNSINETNYGEYFLLYIDNELSAAKRDEVETYVLQHPKLQDEFTTLKQTVLTPENVSYSNKEELYRTERRRVVYLRPWRLAAAAIFIGVCAVGFWMMQRSSTITVADVPSTKQQVQQNAVATKPADNIKQNIQSTEKNIAQQKEKTVSPQLLPKTENKKVVIAASTKNKEQLKTDVAKTTINNNDNKIEKEQPFIIHNNIAEQQKEPPSTINNIAQEPKHLEEKSNEVASLQAIPDKQNQTDYTIYPVAYKELNTNDDDRSLHVGMFDLNKEKVKTFFKKAGRKLTNRSDNNNIN